ncbi:MAG: hypothetical protein HY298_22295 [Verrucomicrobia bacterium]|nr:hypothetical protein [Verrucomicrobiota bacterium]
MNTKNTKMNNDDEALRKALHGWVVTPALPPRFQERVWQGIERLESQPRTTLWILLLDWFETSLPRPALAISYVSVLLVLGLSAGYWQVRKETAHLDETLGLRYVQSIDPYQTSSH